MNDNNEKKSNHDKLSLWNLKLPQGLKDLSIPQCEAISDEIREILVDTVSKTG